MSKTKKAKRHRWGRGTISHHCMRLDCPWRKKYSSERGGASWRYSRDGVSWTDDAGECEGEQ